MSSPKIVFNNTVILATTSVEEDFCFPCNPLVTEILHGCLYKALSHHPVTLCHFVVEATHIHFILYVTNPDDVKGFMERFKTESAHAINRLLGRKKRTIWCEGYDSPPLLDIAKAIDKIIYVYENPSKDGLEDSINKYPGISTWRHFCNHKNNFDTYYIARNDIEQLPDRFLKFEDYKVLRKMLVYKKKRASYKIDPNAWMKAFNIQDPQEIERINHNIIAGVYEREANHRALRKAQKKGIVGAKKLLQQRPGERYVPERAGRRMWCLATDKDIRIQFINFVKSLLDKGKRVLARWRQGDFSLSYPIGLYPPSLPKRANLVQAIAV